MKLSSLTEDLSSPDTDAAEGGTQVFFRCDPETLGYSREAEAALPVIITAVEESGLDEEIFEQPEEEFEMVDYFNSKEVDVSVELFTFITTVKSMK